MMEQSASITALAAALVKAQAEIEGAVKGRVNPAFKSKYADLRSVWDACREQLVTNGLTVVQFPGETVDGRMALTTQLNHESGEWMRSTMSVPLAKADPQGAGSALTYMRRYALAAVIGVCPEDDDGNAASRPAPRHDTPVPARISEAQRQTLMDLAVAVGVDSPTLCGKCQVQTLSELPADKFGPVKAWLESKRKPAPATDIIDDEVPY